MLVEGRDLDETPLVSASISASAVAGPMTFGQRA